MASLRRLMLQCQYSSLLPPDVLYFALKKSECCVIEVVMNYATIKYCDIANGPGVRTSLFVSGCTHHCPNCFNSVAWDFAYGLPFTGQTEQQIIDSMTPFISGLSLLGGEPMEPENQPALLGFLHRFLAACPGKTVWCYSGYTWEELCGDQLSRCRTDITTSLLECIDVLVDGEYIEALHDITLRFRGSSNQRILDVRCSLEASAPVLWQDDPLYVRGRLC